MISLIVLTYRPGGIDILADSLSRTMPGKEPWELVLVDDYPDRVGRGEVQTYIQQRNIPLGWYGGSKNKSYPETKGGLCNATNTGIIHSRGDYLAFLSDYTMVQPNWLQMCEHYQRTFPDAMVTGSAIMFDAPRPDNLGDVTTWKTTPYVYPKWPWVPDEWETFWYCTKAEHWLTLNGLDERADHCHCWPVTSHVSQCMQARIPLMRDPHFSVHMIDHRIWDQDMTEPSPWGPSCGMWRIDHRTSLPEEPHWVVPSPNPFNLKDMRRNAHS